MTSWFGMEEGGQAEPIEVDLFADEVKNIRNRATGDRWHYIGVLAVPLNKKRALLKRLIEARGDCDSEIKAVDLDRHAKRHVARAWIRHLHDDHVHQSIFLSILGINHSLLSRNAFGGAQFAPVYNRFFRSAVLYSCKVFFGGRPVTINKIWHDLGDMQHHGYFPWHVIYRVTDDPLIECRARDVSFIPSDHRKQGGRDESHCLQFVDLILGLTKQLLDDTSRKKSKCDTARLLAALVDRMMNEPHNPHSSFGHRNKYLISFFPSQRLGNLELLDPQKRAQSGFYRVRRLLQKDRESGQMSLFD